MTTKAKSDRPHRKRTIKGDLTIYTATDWASDLLGRLADAATLDVDLSEVQEMDSAGLQILLLLRREADEHECRLNLVHPSAAVLEVLDLLRLRELFGESLKLAADGGAT